MPPTPKPAPARQSRNRTRVKPSRSPTAQCLICDLPVKSKAELTDHIAQQHPPVDAAAMPGAIKAMAICPGCGAKGTLQGLPSHVRQKHPQLPAGEFTPNGEERWAIDMGPRLPTAVVHRNNLNPYGHPWRWAVYRAERSAGPSWKFRDSGTSPSPEKAMADALGRRTETLGGIGGPIQPAESD